MKRKCHTKRILVSLPPLAYQHRQGLEGILAYMHEHHACSWEPWLDTEFLVAQDTVDLREGRYDGILAYVMSDEMRTRLLSLDVPTVFYEPFLSVDTRTLKPYPRAVTIVTDYMSEGRFAARYFMERHYRSFAYVGERDGPFAADTFRQRGFTEELAKHGFECRCFGRGVRLRTQDGDAERQALTRWLKGLPLHTGIFVVRDMRARKVLALAKEAGLQIPAHLAVLGIDDDRCLCETCSPTLSSISTDVFSLGYKVGGLLDELLSGADGKIVVHVPNLRAVTRASTEMDASDDPVVAKALQWIRGHLADNLSVGNVAAGIGFPVRPLQLRFRNELGRSIGGEVRRLRLEAAMQMLRSTGKSISCIADECGFSGASHFGLCMRKTFGMSPAKYKKSQE